MSYTRIRGFPYETSPFARRSRRVRQGGAARGARAALVLVLALATLAAGCGRRGPRPQGEQREFWQAIRMLCGQSFTGELVHVNAADTSLVGQQLVLHVWQCYANELRLAFHVGDDHSRVWLLSPVENGLRLSHAIHKADGTPDPYSGYAGETRDRGSSTLQTFLPDANTVARVPASAGTYWTIEIRPRQRLTYAYHGRDGGARFRVDFDFSARAARPPAPWGYTRGRGRPAGGPN